MNLEPIEPLFDPRPTKVIDKRVAPGTALPIVVRTRPQQWSYAVRFERRIDAVQPSTAVLVRLTLAVISGSVGVGVLNGNETEFMDEVVAGPTPEPTTVAVLITRAGDAGPLIVRNTSSVAASEVSLLGLECLAIERDSAERTPGLADPRPCAYWSRYYGTDGDTIAERLRVKLFRSLEAPEILRWVDRLSMWILPGDQLSRALYVSSTYEPNTLCVLRRLLRSGDTFIDAGANTGVISLVASNWVGPTGRVYSFEPSLREHEQLQRNLALNAATNVTPFNLAVAAGSGTATLRVAAPSHAGLNTIGGEFPYAGVETDHLERVETIALDGFVDRQRVPRIAAIKLDVEGAESAVLHGAQHVLREHRPALIIEIFGRSLEGHGSSREAVGRQLRAADYRIYSIDDVDARLHAIDALTVVDEQNVVALPAEQGERLAV
ncbi:MAG TPA: FkbM family methyltransferase [Vicinamibacterales bacterium]